MDKYRQTLDSLFKLNYGLGMKLGLRNIKELWNYFKNPQDTYKTIHIAGTNGKGSVALKCASALSHSGFKTGLYTSPHLFSFRERIRIDSTMIPKEDVIRLYDKILRTSITATYFETVTMMAFLYYAEQEVDYAVLETGLGGRFDATNIIKSPELTVITSIDYDHTEVLGNTLEQIAFEKAGIIKPGVTTVIGPSVTQQWVQDVVQRNRSALIPVTGDFDTVDEENSAVALQSLLQLSTQNEAMSWQAFAIGCDETQPLRKQEIALEVDGKNINIVLDVGHNIGGMKRLVEEIEAKHKGTISIAIGISKSKEKDAIFELIKSSFDNIYFVTSTNKRLARPQDLETGIGVPTQGSGHVLEILEDIIRQQADQSVLLIAGSFFIMNDVATVLSRFGINIVE